MAVRRNLPFGVGSTWLLVETYLLLHGHRVVAGDDEVGALLASLREERVDASLTLNVLATMVETGDG